MASDPTGLDIVGLSQAYRSGGLKPTEVLEAYLERIGPGAVYRVILEERARAQAERAERRLAQGVDTGPLLGVPIALKDIIELEGQVAAAGSRVLSERPPALEDAPVAARLDAAGAVFLGQTNMTELAFSGLGLNTHYGTPPNALDRHRIPGGSSSGSAVAVATGAACAAVGSDTGGSVRIPAAFNGLVGLKTTDGLIPTDGVVPLSVTLDTLGPIARSLDDAWILFRGMAGMKPAPFPELPHRLLLLVPTTVLLEELEPEVAVAFEAALSRFEAAGHVVERAAAPELTSLMQASERYGALPAHEALACYEELIERRGEEMDPRVTRRILAVRGRPATDYVRLSFARRAAQREFWARATGFDAVVAPTVAIRAPLLRALADDENYFAANRLCLRNTSLFNLLGGPAVTVPLGDGMGLMVAGPPRAEESVLAAAARLATA